MVDVVNYSAKRKSKRAESRGLASERAKSSQSRIDVVNVVDFVDILINTKTSQIFSSFRETNTKSTQANTKLNPGFLIFLEKPNTKPTTKLDLKPPNPNPRSKTRRSMIRETKRSKTSKRRYPSISDLHLSERKTH